MFSFLFNSIINFKKIINPLSGIIIFILIFDVIIMSLLFGNAKLIERIAETSILGEVTRFNLQSFGWEQFKNFLLFGYGSGAFNHIFKIFYVKGDYDSNFVVNHVHNDGIELLGEVGILGFSIIVLIFVFFIKRLINNINEKKQFSRFVLFSLLLMILFFQSLVDFSLHTPGISILLITILSVCFVNFKKEI